MAVHVGSVSVEVVPDASGFVQKFKDKVLAGATEVGNELGRRIGQAAGQAAAGAIADGINDGVRRADPAGGAARQGQKAGGAFARAFKAEVEAAIRNLPDIEIDANTTVAQLEIADVRDELEKLSRKKIDVDFTAADALAKIAQLKAQLQSIPDTTIDVNFDRDEADRVLGELAKRLEVKLDVDPTPAQKALIELREQFAAFQDLDIGVDLSDAEAVEGMRRLQAQVLELAATSPNIQVRLDAAKFAAELGTIRAALGDIPPVDIPVNSPNLGATLTRIKADIAKAAASLPELRIHADSTDVERQVAAIQARLASLSANISVTTDTAGVLAEIELLKSVLKDLDTRRVDINVRADVAKAIADLTAVGLAAEAAGAAGEGGFNRWRVIAGLIFALIPLIAGAVLALAGVFALLVTPIAAIGLGLDGIKKAAEPLVAAFDKIQQSTSNAFSQGLGPAIQNILVLMPTLQVGLANTAITLSQMATEISSVVRNGANLDTIASSFRLIDVVLASLTPATKLLTQNIIDLTNIGLKGMLSFGTQLTQIGQDWAALITRLSASGTAQAAVSALFQVLASVIGLLGPLTEFGAVILASFGPALASAFQILGAVLSAFAQALDQVSEPLRTLIAIGTVVVTTMLILGLSFPTAAASMGVFTGALAAVRLALINFGAGVQLIGQQFTTVAASQGVIRGAMAATAAAASLAAGTIRAVGLALVNSLPTLLIIGFISLLTAMGQANANSAAEAAQHANAVKELGQALQDSGNKINSNIISLTQGKIAALGLDDQFKSLAATSQLAGVTQQQVASAVANGGPAYDSLVAKLKAISAEQVNGSRIADADTVAKNKAAAAARTLLDAIAPLRQEFVDVAVANKQLADALLLTGTSLVGGLANAKSLEAALATLSSTASSTSDKITALKAALDSLNGGAVTADDAASKLNASLLDLKQHFDDANASIAGPANALVGFSGAVVTTTKEGQALQSQLSSIRTNMLEAATTAFDAAGGLGDLGNASKAASDKVAIARDSIIKAAEAAGIAAPQAQLLADHLQAIPALVVSLLTLKNYPQAAEEIAQISARLSQVPGKVDVNVGVITKPALDALSALHIAVTQNMDGTFTIHADDQTRPALNAAIQAIQNSKAQVPVTALNNTAPGVAAAVQDIQTRKDALLPVSTNNTAVPAGAAAAASTVANTPAPMPVTPDTKTVVPGAQAAAGQVAAIQAVLNIEPGGLAFVRTAIDEIRFNIATPVNFSVGMVDNVTRQLQPLQAAISTPQNIPISATDVGAAGLIAALRSNAVQLVNMPITAVDSGASGLINSLRGNAQTVSVMPISAEDSQARGVLGNLVATVTGTTSVMHIDAVVDLATGKLTAFKVVVEGTTAIMKIDANVDLANQKLADLVTKINGTTATVKVNADVTQAENDLNNLARPRTSTLTVTIQTVGAIPQAHGGIIPAFANGGFATLPTGRATIVPPNTPRLIGDRATDDEAYIPINRSARSRSLLGITAGAMGFGLIPMAQGGLVSGIDSILRLAQGLNGGSINTQQTSSFLQQSGTTTGNDTSSVEAKLDQVVAALKEIKPGPGSITVEDRSGNPVETARATQLALRLAR